VDTQFATRRRRRGRRCDRCRVAPLPPRAVAEDQQADREAGWWVRCGGLRARSTPAAPASRRRDAQTRSAAKVVAGLVVVAEAGHRQLAGNFDRPTEVHASAGAVLVAPAVAETPLNETRVSPRWFLTSTALLSPGIPAIARRCGIREGRNGQALGKQAAGVHQRRQIARQPPLSATKLPTTSGLPARAGREWHGAALQRSRVSS
jgi:hypothetical protein